MYFFQFICFDFNSGTVYLSRMNTTEKLDAIADKCRELLAQNAGLKTAAGWRTTLAAIAALDGMGARGAAVLGDAIIAAWEGLL
jgi:hypothetical protein